MILSLQKKFVRTAMIAVTVLILVLLGGVNGFHIWVQDNQAQQMLFAITQREGVPPMGKDPRFLFPTPNEDRKLSARFFRVIFDRKGEIVEIDVSRIASVTKENAKEYAAKAGDRKEGRVERFRFRETETGSGERVLFFLDVSTERQSILTVLAISAGIGLVCWLGTLLLVILLSKKAIRPLAENMEKQRQFVTNAGHEIKTPLAIIQANTEAMELCQGESKWSKNIKTQTVRLHGLMENLLTLARMEEASLHNTPQTVGLTSLAREGVQAFQEGAGLRGIAIETRLQEEVSVQGDKDQIAQLISILLDNAVKYTDPGGMITVETKAQEGEGFLRVYNAPTKLPEGDVEQLFDRFYRGDPARTQRTGGYGIGLSAARAIAENWKGTLTAQAEKDGICFVLHLESVSS